jgi:hypothetical protein
LDLASQLLHLAQQGGQQRGLSGSDLADHSKQLPSGHAKADVLQGWTARMGLLAEDGLGTAFGLFAAFPGTIPDWACGIFPGEVRLLHANV